MPVVGVISELHRYPVKSMLGEEIQSIRIGTRGLPGDRICALLDTQTSKIASAKVPRLWRQLLECSATYDDATNAANIILPDGRCLSPSDDLANNVMSSLLEREVNFSFSRIGGLEVDRSDPEQVARYGIYRQVNATVVEIGNGSPGGGFFDAFPIHFVTTSSLEKIAEKSISKISEPVRFRPNIVISSPEIPPFAEAEWEGSILAIGADLRLRVTISTPRCAVPTLQHGNLKSDPGLTMEIAKLNRLPVLDLRSAPCLGAYAQVEKPGSVRLGDWVNLEIEGRC